MFGEDDLIRRSRPRNLTRRSLHPRRQILRLAAARRDRVDVAACDAFVAHQSADECYLFAVGRPVRLGYLRRWFQQRLQHARLRRHRVELRDEPVVVAGAVRRRQCEATRVGRPVVLVDVHVGRRDLTGRAGHRVNDSESLLVNVLFYHARVGGRGLRRPRDSRSVLGEEEREASAVGRPVGRREVAVERGQLSGPPDSGVRDVEFELSRLVSIREEGDAA